MPTGGDGTFLLASSRIRDNSKPVIGFNSDPSRSEGHLCLPKKYSANIRRAVEKLQSVKLSVLFLSRQLISFWNAGGFRVAVEEQDKDKTDKSEGGSCSEVLAWTARELLHGRGRRRSDKQGRVASAGPEWGTFSILFTNFEGLHTWKLKNCRKSVIKQFENSVVGYHILCQSWQEEPEQ